MPNDEKPTNGQLIRAERERRQWSQADLAQRVGTHQQTIEKIESGKVAHSRYLGKIGAVLGIQLGELGEINQPTESLPLHPKVPLVGERTLPVYGAVEGGDGALAITADPVDYVRRPAPLAEVRDAYGVIIVGESMVPELKPGETALVHPHLPPAPNEPCVFYSDDGEGSVKASVKVFCRQTATHWHVAQHNPPKKFSLPKSEWQKAHCVVGKYSRR